jgi:hypothetical protein
MMFLIKLAFWGCLILLLMPSSTEDKQALYDTLKQTAHDLSQFCTRNPGVCEKAQNGFFHVVQKVRVGAEMLEETLSDSAATPLPHLNAAQDPPSVSAASDKNQNTLNEDDLVPAWRAPK